jgi:hypothetical protein
VNPALGPFAIASLLLVTAGVLKGVQPGDTTRALRGVGLPARDAVVRVGGVVEMVLGVVALLAADAVVAVLVAASYTLFAVFVAVALAEQAPISTCGCFGKVDAQPSLVHLGVSVGAVVGAIAMAVDPSVAPIDVLDEPFAEAAAYVLLVLAGTTAAFIAMTWLPRAFAAARSPALG